MTEITTREPKIRPVSPMDRRADALAELQQLHAEFAALQTRCEEQQRIIHRHEDRNHLLLDELRTSRQNERVVTRKLIRLAAAMANIGSLSREAEAIMVSAREWQDDDAAMAKAPPPEARQEAPPEPRRQEVVRAEPVRQPEPAQEPEPDTPLFLQERPEQPAFRGLPPNSY